MSLIFYASASPAIIDKTIGKALKSFRPNIPPHQFKSLALCNSPPIPGEGNVVLMCGVEALSILQQGGKAPKNKGLNALREIALACPQGGWWLLTFDPKLIETKPEVQEVLGWDIRLAHRLMTTGSLKPKVGEYVWVSSYLKLIAEIEAEYEKTGQPVKVSFDTETEGLYPWYDNKDFVCCSFTHKPGVAQMLYFGPQPGAVPLDHSQPLIDQIHWLLNSPKVRLRMANGKYDLIWIKEKWGIDCTNFTFDTLLVGSLVNENRTNSLNLHAKLMTDFGGYDDDFGRKYDKGQMEKAPVEDLRVYQGGDTDSCYRVADVLQAELDDDPLLKRFYITILHPAARAFEKLERRGVLVDQQAMAVLRDDLKKAIKESQNKQLELMPAKMVTKYRERIDDQLAKGKNPLLPTIMHEFFFTPFGLNLKPLDLTPKDQKPSLAKSYLRMAAEGNPDAVAFIAEMTAGDTATKVLSTFVDGFLKHLRPDGRLHPSYMLFHGGFGDDEGDESGSTTGRLSAKEPAFQCMVAETLVLTSVGYVRLDQIVASGGEECRVLTHTGEWRNVVGVYRNGLKLVYRVRLSSGHEVVCTDNHPILTDVGFIRTNKLKVGDAVYEIARAYEREEIYHVPELGGHEGPMRHVVFQRLQALRRQGYRVRPRVESLRGVPCGYGDDASWVLARAEGRERSLYEGELLLDPARPADTEHEGQSSSDDRRRDALLERVGPVSEDHTLGAPQASEERVVVGAGALDACAAHGAGYEVAYVDSIELIGERETFDLTIDRCHSFVANGVVVHNTIPKKPPKSGVNWAQRLRACYPAPPGKYILGPDYSQGELKVHACLANEKTMIRLFLEGKDMHEVTGAKLAMVEFDTFHKWKGHSDPHLALEYKRIRDQAKPANFGLLYLQSPPGFQSYAWRGYGLKLSLAEAKKIHDDFFALYEDLEPYATKQKNLARLHGQVRSPLGRVRHLPTIRSPDRKTVTKAERQAVNFPTQATLADIMEWAIARIDQELGEQVEIVGNVHDQLVAYVDQSKVDTLVPQVMEIMSGLPFHQLGWDPALKFTADAEVGLTLADLKKWQPLAIAAE